MAPRTGSIVDSDGSLQSASLDVERRDRVRVVSVMIGIYPGLGTVGAVRGDDDDDVL